MHSISVGRRRYSDPDVVSLIRSTGQLIDPRFTVISEARRLIAECDDLDFSDPVRRLAILASMRGFRVEEMDRTRSASEPRDAVVMPTNHGSRGIILFNPSRPRGRVAFSIAHEIVHTFFPNSVSGARFRSLCSPESRQARELEVLCDLGASELLMPARDFLRITGGRMGLQFVENASTAFGSSFEATNFRFATTYNGLAAAGLLRFRCRVGQDRRRAAVASQTFLFQTSASIANSTSAKYRRQSFFTSAACDADEFIVRWNKSFDESSCVYRAGKDRITATGIELLPNEADIAGRIDAIPAPFQRPEADAENPDVLFLWWKED